MFLCEKCNAKYTAFQKVCTCGNTKLTYVKDVVEKKETEKKDEEDEAEDESLSSSKVVTKRYADFGIDTFIKKCSAFHLEKYGDARPVLATTWLDQFEEYIKGKRVENQCDGCLEVVKTSRTHAHNILSASILNYYPPQVVVSFARLFYGEKFDIHPSLRFKLTYTGPMAKVAAAWCNWVPNLHQTRQTLEKLCVALMEVAYEDNETGDNFERSRVALNMLAKMRFFVVLNMDKAPSEVVQSLPINWDLSVPAIVKAPPKAYQMNKPLQGSVNSYVDAVFKINGNNAKRFGFALQCNDCELKQGDMALPWRYFFGKPGARLASFLTERCYKNPFLLAMDLSSMALADMWNAFVKGDKQGLGYLFGLPLASIKNWHLFMIYFTVCMFEGALGCSPFRPDENLVLKGTKTYV